MKAILAERGFEDLSFGTVGNYRADPSFNGLTIAEIARKVRGADDFDAQLETARQILLGGDAPMVYHVMSEEDLEADHAPPAGVGRVRQRP